MPEGTPELITLEFHSPNREFLESRGWTYKGSAKMPSSPGFVMERYRHYFGKGAQLLLADEATMFEVTPTLTTRSYIDADIQALNVSKTRKYQLMWARQGRCVACGGELEDKTKRRCSKHLTTRKKHRSAKKDKSL